MNTPVVWEPVTSLREGASNGHEVNLRMCEDCHALFEHAAQLFRARITVRDTAVVHEFGGVGGGCSCGGTWRWQRAGERSSGKQPEAVA